MPTAPDAPRPLLDQRRLTLRDWYVHHHRDLPWRRPDCSAWGVLVSEVMLQQTPVARVVPVWTAWLARWPAPQDLAADSPGAAVAAWGALGYPRRALRLHTSAGMCVRLHEGRVPDSHAALRALPGVGDYTAAAVASFAFGRRHAVLDTNIRRVLARLMAGEEFQPPGAPSAAERSCAESLLPTDGLDASAWNMSLMELGALVCTARSPRCGQCPLASSCAWLAAGSPTWSGPARRGQTWHGTDRQARGRLMATVREAYASGTTATDEQLASAWPDDPQRTRALASLVRDGLLAHHAHGYRLPT